MAAQRRGAVNVFVQPEKDSFEAITTLFLLLPLGQHLEEELGAASVEFHVAELVDAEQANAATAGDGLGQLLLIGGFDELVDQLGHQDVLHSVTLHRGLGAQGDEHVGLAGSGVPDQTERLTLLDPLAAGESADGGGVDVRVGVEVKGPQRLLPGEARGLDPSFRTAPGPVVALRHQQLSEEATVGHLILARPVGDLGELVADRRKPQQTTRSASRSSSRQHAEPYGSSSRQHAEPCGSNVRARSGLAAKTGGLAESGTVRRRSGSHVQERGMNSSRPTIVRPESPG